MPFILIYAKMLRMEKFELIAPCHFGLEAVLKREIDDLGYNITRTEDGRVFFEGDAEAVAYANVFLRTAERILINAATFKAETFDELFEGTKAIPWERYIPKDARFFVTKAGSVKSKLFSPSDIQSIMKKAMVEHLRGVYHTEWFPETGVDIPVRAFIYKDEVTVGLDTTGVSLHKRGYRKLKAAAPIAENLAAALIMLTPWKGERILIDPFCGSGTIPIEAALMAADIAPGMYRSFNAEGWGHLVSESLWKNAKEDASDRVNFNINTDIQGYDADDEMVKISRANAAAFGVDKLIHFQKRDVSQLDHPKKYGFIITNPPYGERLEEKEALFSLYNTLGERYKLLDAFSMYVITSYADAEQAIGLKSAKNRKIYNGMLKTYFYSFPGPKPPKRT